MSNIPVTEFQLYRRADFNIDGLVSTHGNKPLSRKALDLLKEIVFDWGMGAAINATAANFQLELLQVKQEYWRIYWGNDPVLFEELSADPEFMAEHNNEHLDPTTLDD